MEGRYYIGGDIVSVSNKAIQKEHYRWDYMDEKQLKTRLNRITNLEKLTAYYVKAQWTNKPELAQAAFDRYQLLKGYEAQPTEKEVVTKKKVVKVKVEIEEKYVKENIKTFNRALDI